MKAYYITDWEKLYEVNDKGHPWKSGEKKRAKPLPFVRWHVYGPAGDNLRYMEAASGISGKYGNDRWPVAFALFGKLLEVASRQNRKYRGYVLGRGNSRISGKMLEMIACFTETQVEQGLEALSDSVCGWIEEREIPGLPENPAVPEIPGCLQEPEPEPEHELKEEKNETEEHNSVLGGEQPATETPGSVDSENNFSGGDSDSGSEKKKEIAKNGEQQPRQVCNPVGVGRVVAKYLGYNPKPLPAKQQSADRTCFKRIGELIVAGKLGPPNDAANLCYEQAQRIRVRDGTRNAIARFLAWFKKELAKHGNEWAAKEEAEVSW